MTWTYWEEIKPSRTLSVRKRIWDHQRREFLEVRFVRVFISNDVELRRAIDDHRRDHGDPQYQGAWWHDGCSIWLRESLATFWLLKTGD
jgi:hypothetical protein